MEPNDSNSTTWWISSLAISVVCCSVLFVVFAGYIFDLKEGIAVEKIRIDMMNERMNQIDAEIENVRHHSSVQQIQIIPMPAGTPVEAPSATAPSEAGKEAQPADAMKPVPAPIVPPAASPKAIPEVPAKP